MHTEHAFLNMMDVRKNLRIFQKESLIFLEIHIASLSQKAKSWTDTPHYLTLGATKGLR
jgi:hypothetical protein